MKFLLYLIVLSCRNFTQLCKKTNKPKTHWHGVFNFWKLYEYLNPILDKGQHVTHSVCSGHILFYEENNLLPKGTFKCLHWLFRKLYYRGSLLLHRWWRAAFSSKLIPQPAVEVNYFVYNTVIHLEKSHRMMKTYETLTKMTNCYDFQLYILYHTAAKESSGSSKHAYVPFQYACGVSTQTSSLDRTASP